VFGIVDRRRPCDADIIELCVRWYITYRLSYRDLVEMMAERGSRSRIRLSSGG
jgi:transposase-like protein